MQDDQATKDYKRGSITLGGANTFTGVMAVRAGTLGASSAT